MDKCVRTDEQIDKAWGNANFGPDANKRAEIAKALGKTARGYSNGYTISCICAELGLIGRVNQKLALTNDGLEFLLRHADLVL